MHINDSKLIFLLQSFQLNLAEIEKFSYILQIDDEVPVSTNLLSSLLLTPLTLPQELSPHDVKIQRSSSLLLLPQETTMPLNNEEIVSMEKVVKINKGKGSLGVYLSVIFLGEMQCIAFRLMLSSCVSVCLCLCVYATFVDLRKTA